MQACVKTTKLDCSLMWQVGSHPILFVQNKFFHLYFISKGLKVHCSLVVSKFIYDFSSFKKNRFDQYNYYSLFLKRNENSLR